MQPNLHEVIRVNHAGEYAAKHIYLGQLRILRNHKVISEMQQAELVHLEYFEQQLIKNQIRPSALLPLWHAASTILGVTSALLGEKAAMACTKAVEEVIGEHYNTQIQNLDEGELKETITKFAEDELEHLHTAVNYKAEEAICYSPLSAIVKFGCKLAIKIAKKI